ncbi:hypothetical protein [Rhizobium sp. MHM7A]|uniref:hypothetical protein n=1 Tax=Rhizobium sp. MHM7A TaxID=2583233 RepID=UPI001105E28A|nr:hypothetical protein [Rhizobium sp. MHM7A]TLX16265.1 hypothetical protein FFR93_02755 [Rhizobium sp. MHM7A]
MTAFKVITAAVFLVSAPAYGGSSVPPSEKVLPSFDVSENRERLAFHNRCVAAATYAMLDDHYAEKDAKAEYHRHLEAGEAIIRRVIPARRGAFVSTVPTTREYASVYRSLGWGTRVETFIKSEYENCKAS